jgi:hypothetical protein
MKKVGLLTYHASHNMGSIMQAYAMVHILRSKYGLDVEIINFSSRGQRDLYSLFSKQPGLKGAIKNVLISVLYPMFLSRHGDFESSISSIFKVSQEFYSETKALAGVFDGYDYVLVGSDQVWNLSCSDFEDAYFLPFKTSAKKISYAPSFGGKNILKSGANLDKYRDYMQDFDAISVRERNGKAWIRAISGIDAPLVADPTLLVDRCVYDGLLEEREFLDDYIFFYGIPFSAKTYDALSFISKKYNMPIVMLDIKPWIFRGNFFRGFKLSRRSTPGSYLSLIKYAKFVLTTSFHGSIFSAIYEKDFWQLTFKESNVEDDRLLTLLDQMGAPERKVYMENIENHDFLEPVNYRTVESSLDPLRKSSWHYLDCCFSENRVKSSAQI